MKFKHFYPILYRISLYKKLWLLLFLVSLSECTEVQLPANLSTEPALNTTTLYPVSESNITQKETSSPEPKLKTEATAWKIDAAYSMPKEDDKNETSKEAGKSINASEEFRPSPHLGSFYEVEGLQIPPTQVPLDFNPVLNKPSDLHIPPKRFRPEFPYKMESPVFTRAVEPWKPSSFEAQPTAESPVKVPAGGLYKIPEPFNKDKPGLGDDFALDLNGHKDTTTLHKRPSPWKGLLNLLTAFLPVGLIISALTPSLITIHDSDNPYPDHGFRRRAEPVPPLPAISEQCRRRLLCELHNDKNYGTLSRRKPKRCYKIPCDDPAALSTTLNWLLSHQPHHPEDLREPFT